MQHHHSHVRSSGCHLFTGHYIGALKFLQSICILTASKELSSSRNLVMTIVKPDFTLTHDRNNLDITIVWLGHLSLRLLITKIDLYLRRRKRSDADSARQRPNNSSPLCK